MIIWLRVLTNLSQLQTGLIKLLQTIDYILMGFACKVRLPMWRLVFSNQIILTNA